MSELTEYLGRDIEDYITSSIPDASPTDVFVFLMGPYRLLDPSYLYPNEEFPLAPDPLAPATDAVSPDAIRATLREICKRVTDETGATVFIASDVDVPTKREVARDDLDEPGMSVSTSQ